MARQITPISEFPDFMSVWMQILSASGGLEDIGMRSERRYARDLPTIRQALKDKNVSDQTIDILRERGLDVDKAYGQDTDNIKDIANRVEFLSRYDLNNNENYGPGTDKFERSVDNLIRDARQYGEAPHTFEMVPLEGVAGMSKLEKYEAIVRANEQFGGDLSASNLAQITGIEGLTDKDVQEFQSLAGSKEFQQYETVQDIATRQLDLQRQAVEFQEKQMAQYQEALTKVQAPEYIEETIGAAFAPAETELAQYYEPTGGAQVSEAGQRVGAGQAALGRTGSAAVAAELAKEHGRAKERLEASKTAARGQLQQYVDLGLPTEALRFGSQLTTQGAQLGPQAISYAQQPQQQLMNPFQQVFPLASQTQQAQLLPYSMSSYVPSGPGPLDYVLGGLSAVAPIGAAFAGRAG